MVIPQKNMRQILKYTPLLLFNLFFLITCIVIYSNTGFNGAIRVWYFVAQFYFPSILVLTIYQKYLVKLLLGNQVNKQVFIIRTSILLVSGIIFFSFIQSEFKLNALGQASTFISVIFWLTITFLGLLLISTSHFTEYWYRQELTNLTTEKQRIQSELSLLKSQINPHFLFNTLNNIYGLVYMKDDRAPQLIGKLSQLLRYLLYDCSTPRVSLFREKEMLQQYLGLQSLKSNDIAQRIDFYCDGIENHHQIMPMLLINFVENCFKHSNIENSVNAWIKISLEVEGNTLLFQTQNTIETTIYSTIEKGIGLTNTLKMLDAEYVQNYTLTKSLTNGVFTLRLNLNLI